MNRKNIQKWVDALRSGNFRQGQGTLCTGGRYYCCLGVACEIAIENGVEISKRTDQFSNYTYYNNEPSTLPIIVRDWLGVDSHDPVVEGESLSNWNDVRGANFSTIADMIEEAYLR